MDMIIVDMVIVLRAQMLNEDNKDEVILDLLSWLKKHRF